MCGDADERFHTKISRGSGRGRWDWSRPDRPSARSALGPGPRPGFFWGRSALEFGPNAGQIGPRPKAEAEKGRPNGRPPYKSWNDSLLKRKSLSLK